MATRGSGCTVRLALPGPGPPRAFRGGARGAAGSDRLLAAGNRMGRVG